MARWVKLISVYSEETAKKLVSILNNKGFVSDYSSSSPDYPVWIRDGEEVRDKLLSIIAKHLKVIKKIEEHREIREITYLDFDYSEMYEAIPHKYTLK